MWCSGDDGISCKAGNGGSASIRPEGYLAVPSGGNTGIDTEL